MNENVNVLREGIDNADVSKLKEGALSFLEGCRDEGGGYKLTHLSDISPFTHCFGVFLLQFLGRLSDTKDEHPKLADRIVKGLYEYKEERQSVAKLDTDKGFLQLLAFTLSALHLLGEANEHPLEELIPSLLPNDMGEYLNRIRAFEGVPQSGNLAMCMAVIAIYARDELGTHTGELIEDWVSMHLESMNGNGFWGEERVTHLQFQNGYHQYEILEYLGVHNGKVEKAVEFVRQIADRRGQFAPYFGGSGCYDYDAVSIITAPEREFSDEDKSLLIKTGETILSECNRDGGFSESQWIRPRSIKRIYSGARKVLSARGTTLRNERGRHFVALQIPKHDRIHTHWTQYSREWSESNLWDTWFRLLTIARIDTALCGENRSRWGFIDFPGIGYHGSGRSSL
jgi:hypothetical protein